MTFSLLLDNLLHDTLAVSLPAFGAELALCVTIVAMLVTRIVGLPRRVDSAVMFLLALVGSAAALGLVAPWSHLTHGRPLPRTEIFTGLLVYDAFAVYIRALLAFFLLLFVVFTKLSGIPDREDRPDFYTLVFGATLGMCLMASANHMLMVFLAVEMASVPSYCLAGMLKGRREASESALKYAVYGAGAAGVMLYGISLLCGVTGSAHLPTMAARLSEILANPEVGAARMTVLGLGGLMVMVGLAFKLSAVPFHFWCPDVFEGASAEVNAFLSVASKAGALALLVRVALGLGVVPADPHVAAAPRNGVVASASEAQPALDVRLVSTTGAAATESDEKHAGQPLQRARDYMYWLLALVSAVTCTFGNLAAYGQTNIKRLLAYSTIAHAGYMIMPVAAAVVLLGSDRAGAEEAVASLAMYAAVYLFMNLGAFAIVAFLRNELRSEEIKSYSGLIRRSPGITLCFATILFSLVGLPPLAGFAGKFAIFAALVDARLYTLLTIAGVNTAISLFYYLRVVKTMTLDAEAEDRAPAQFPLISAGGVYVALVTLPVLLLGVWWDELSLLAKTAASTLL